MAQREPGVVERRLMADGRLALLGALIWVFAALGLPAPLAVIPIALGVLALVLLGLALRLRGRPAEGSDGGRSWATPDLVALAVAAAAGLVVLVVQLV